MKFDCVMTGAQLMKSNAELPETSECVSLEDIHKLMEGSHVQGGPFNITHWRHIQNCPRCKARYEIECGNHFVARHGDVYEVII